MQMAVSGHCSTEGYEDISVMLDEGHSEWLTSYKAEIFTESLEERNYVVDSFKGTITQKVLRNYDVLIIGTAWTRFSAFEIDAIVKFVDDGGGLLLTGVGWSWIEHRGSPIENYPMNKLAARFGAYFNKDIIQDHNDWCNGTFVKETLHACGNLTFTGSDTVQHVVAIGVAISEGATIIFHKNIGDVSNITV